MTSSASPSSPQPKVRLSPVFYSALCDAIERGDREYLARCASNYQVMLRIFIEQLNHYRLMGFNWEEASK